MESQIFIKTQSLQTYKILDFIVTIQGSLNLINIFWVLCDRVRKILTAIQDEYSGYIITKVM